MGSLSAKFKPLPDRQNVVLSRQENFELPDEVMLFSSLNDALDTLAISQNVENSFIIGGANLYREAFPLADKLYLTQIFQEFEGNVFISEIDFSKWKCIEEEEGEENNIYYKFLTYDRRE